MIDSAKEERVYPYRWNRKLYRNPPRANAGDLIIADEELARVEELCLDKVRSRLQQKSCIRVEKTLHTIEIGNLVITTAPRNVAEPVYIGQVLLRQTGIFNFKFNLVIE